MLGDSLAYGVTQLWISRFFPLTASLDENEELLPFPVFPDYPRRRPATSAQTGDSLQRLLDVLGCIVSSA